MRARANHITRRVPGSARGALASLVIACAALALPATALATPDALSADQAAVAVAQAVDLTAQASDAPIADDESGVTSATTVDAPATAAGAIRLANGTDQPRLGIGIPGSAPALETDGGTVYASGGEAVVAQQLADGSLRLAVTIPGADSPREYRYPLQLPDGVVARLDEDGGIDLVHQAGGDDAPSTVVGRIDAPWATDADGNAVPTSFRMDGDTLIQRVEFTAESAFPVVANPSVIWKWGFIPIGIKFNAAETKKARNPAILVSMMSGVCWALAVETVGASCGVVAVLAGGWAAMASNAYGDHHCLYIYGVVPWSKKC